MTVGIVEERYWGGVCLDTGCIPSKALLRNAEIAFIVTHHATAFGISGDVSFDYSRAVSRSREVAEARVRGVHFLVRKNSHHWDRRPRPIQGSTAYTCTCMREP